MEKDRLGLASFSGHLETALKSHFDDGFTELDFSPENLDQEHNNLLLAGKANLTQAVDLAAQNSIAEMGIVRFIENTKESYEENDMGGADYLMAAVLEGLAKTNTLRVLSESFKQKNDAKLSLAKANTKELVTTEQIQDLEQLELRAGQSVLLSTFKAFFGLKVAKSIKE